MCSGKRIVTLIKGPGNSSKIRKDLQAQGRFPELWIGEGGGVELEPLPWVLTEGKIAEILEWLRGLKLPSAASSNPSVLFNTPKSRQGKC